jgi:hypothetical protein
VKTKQNKKKTKKKQKKNPPQKAEIANQPEQARRNASHFLFPYLHFQPGAT